MEALQESIRVFCEKEISPIAEQIDKSNDFPAHLWKKLGDMGLLGITVEENYGGRFRLFRTRNSNARSQQGISVSRIILRSYSNLCVNQIRLNGSKEQRKIFT